MIRRLTAAVLAGVVLSATVAGCSPAGPGAANGPFMVWDPYTQYGDSSVWAQLLTKCANAYGASINRSTYGAGDLVGKEVAAASQGESPDILIVADQDVPTLVGDKVLAPTSVTHLDTSAVQPNLLSVGQADGATYGMPIGVDTVALYYNSAILRAAHVDPSSITDWATLAAALGKVKAAGKSGITFAAAAGDDASWQFEPWLWGAGGTLTSLDSPAAAAALKLLRGWVADGYASGDVALESERASWTTFAAGDTAFAENDAVHASSAAKLGFDYGVIPMPAENGGAAAAPITGESITIPAQQGAYRYAIDDKIVACLQSSGLALSIDSGLDYVGASATVQNLQVKEAPGVRPWVTVAHSAKAQTADGVGGRYRQISQRLGVAVHAAVDGSEPARTALDSAQG